MTIQWFPGHMTRARRQIEDKLKLIDVVIELLDARIPLASRNPMMDVIVREKPRLVVLNKFDLADPIVTEQWNQHFLSQGHRVLQIDSTTGKNLNQISPLCKQLLADKIAKQVRKGINPRAFRALIVGIPNVGKSTLINKLSGRSLAATGDKPGITKAQQWIKVGTEMELLDTPGILWPKFEDQEVGYKLAVTGAIKEDILHIEDVAFYAIKYMVKHYPGRLQERYGIEQLPDDLTDSNQIVEVMEDIGRKRGCVVSGGRIDLEKTSGVILRELRAGKLDRLSFETP
jgi:ribosome biogenesis GTPase A